MYKIDSGSFTAYTTPIVYNETGTHTLVYYSVDNAGNVEDQKSQNFSVPSIAINIKGGLGITATITNGGLSTTDFSWSIAVTGLVFPREADGITSAVVPGGSATAKATVFGIGPTTITVTANGIEKTAKGFVLLVFVLGVK
jgi:hypothetical protein